MTIPIVGNPNDRVDGRHKVTGGAKYASEHHLDQMTYGVLVMSTIASGAIESLDTKDALKSAGVIAVSEEVISTSQVSAGNQNWFTRIYGESPEYFDIRQWPLSNGASFTGQDVRSSNKVCVIGRTTASQVFGSEDPIGQVWGDVLETLNNRSASSACNGLERPSAGRTSLFFTRHLGTSIWCPTMRVGRRARCPRHWTHVHHPFESAWWFRCSRSRLCRHAALHRSARTPAARRQTERRDRSPAAAGAG